MTNNNQNNVNMLEEMQKSIGIQQSGVLFTDTTQGLAAKLTEEISTSLGISSLENIIITPKVTRKNEAGVEDFMVTAFFSTSDPNGDVYYNNKKNNNRNSNTIFEMAGISGRNYGQFGMSEKFIQTIKPLCKVGNNGDYLLNLKSVQKVRDLVSLELNFYSLMCLALNIKPNDPFNFSIVYCDPIYQGNGDGNITNFDIGIIKRIVKNRNKGKGKYSHIDYNRLEQDQYNKLNNVNNNNNGGRRYN